jgi:hypothetical protein
MLGEAGGGNKQMLFATVFKVRAGKDQRSLLQNGSSEERV